jgi:hypothetical protein
MFLPLPLWKFKTKVMLFICLCFQSRRLCSTLFRWIQLWKLGNVMHPSYSSFCKNHFFLLVSLCIYTMAQTRKNEVQTSCKSVVLNFHGGRAKHVFKPPPPHWKLDGLEKDWAQTRDWKHKQIQMKHKLWFWIYKVGGQGHEVNYNTNSSSVDGQLVNL